MREMALQASAGETIYLQYAGIHSGSLTLVTGSGTTEFSHGEILARPKAKGRLFESSDRVRIFRTKREGKIAYLVWLLRPDYNQKPSWEPRIWVTGTGISGNDADREILSKLKIELNGQNDCDRTYAYGWGMLFGDEPLSKKKNQ